MNYITLLCLVFRSSYTRHNHAQSTVKISITVFSLILVKTYFVLSVFPTSTSYVKKLFLPLFLFRFDVILLLTTFNRQSFSSLVYFILLCFHFKLFHFVHFISVLNYVIFLCLFLSFFLSFAATKYYLVNLQRNNKKSRIKKVIYESSSFA